MNNSINQTKPQEQFSVTVNLVVKANDKSHADSLVSQKLNQWFLETNESPYPYGTLLMWNYLESR